MKGPRGIVNFLTMAEAHLVVVMKVVCPTLVLGLAAILENQEVEADLGTVLMKKRGVGFMLQKQSRPLIKSLN